MKLKLPFVSRSELNGALIREERLQRRINRQELFELHVPMLTTITDGRDDGLENIAIIGSKEGIEKIEKTFSSKTTHEHEVVQLILDLHNKKWSMDSDKFLRILNIDPTPYEKKYWKDKK